MERIRILIVDDHRLFRQGLVSLLASEPALEIVATAAGGEEALVLTAQTEPDVALVDLKMPGMSGIELIPRLLACRPTIGIVVLTASEENSDLLAAVRAGARGYALKNADADVLLDVIRQVHAGNAGLCQMSTPKVMEIIRALQTAHVADATLTPREREVVQLITAGANNGEIAGHLLISENTVKTHVAHILDKLGIKHRSELITWAAQSGYQANRVTPAKQP